MFICSCQEDLHWNQYLTTLISSCHKMFKILMDNQYQVSQVQAESSTMLGYSLELGCLTKNKLRQKVVDI